MAIRMLRQPRRKPLTAMSLQRYRSRADEAVGHGMLREKPQGGNAQEQNNYMKTIINNLCIPIYKCYDDEDSQIGEGYEPA